MLRAELYRGQRHLRIQVRQIRRECGSKLRVGLVAPLESGKAHVTSCRHSLASLLGDVGNQVGDIAIQLLEPGHIRRSAQNVMTVPSDPQAGPQPAPAPAWLDQLEGMPRPQRDTLIADEYGTADDLDWGATLSNRERERFWGMGENEFNLLAGRLSAATQFQLLQGNPPRWVVETLHAKATNPAVRAANPLTSQDDLEKLLYHPDEHVSQEAALNILSLEAIMRAVWIQPDRYDVFASTLVFRYGAGTTVGQP